VRLSDAAGAAGEVRSLVRDSAAAFAAAELGRPLGTETSMLKIWATETYCRLVDLLIEVAGDGAVIRRR
jgi:alkylation response protein AidB-like acyl-CoA dehydrogenase